MWRLHKLKMSNLFMKLDIHKAFDVVNWGYLLDILHDLGFVCRCHDWFSIIFRTSTSITLLNGRQNACFSHIRGIRQATHALHFLASDASRIRLEEGLEINYLLFSLFFLLPFFSLFLIFFIPPSPFLLHCFHRRRGLEPPSPPKIRHLFWLWMMDSLQRLLDLTTQCGFFHSLAPNGSKLENLHVCWRCGHLYQTNKRGHLSHQNYPEAFNTFLGLHINLQKISVHSIRCKKCRPWSRPLMFHS